MTPNERRAEIMRILTTRRHETMGRLAAELHVSIRTIRSDITMLTVDYPLETQRGNGGCVKVADWYHPSKKTLAPEQMALLKKLAPSLEGNDLVIMNSIISQFAP